MRFWRECECWQTLTLRRLAMTCRRRLMLTGTPLQNDLEELQNLLSFLLPDVFQADVAAQLAGEQVRAGAAPSADVARLPVSLCIERRRLTVGRWTRGAVSSVYWSP